jgi:hypothetical protein
MVRLGRRTVFRAAAVAACFALLCPTPANSLHVPSLPLAMSDREGMRLRGGGPLDIFKKLAPAPVAPPPAPRASMPTGSVEVLTVLVMAAITHFARPSTLTPVGGIPTVQHVFYYGWVAALSTGLGALPLIFLGKVTDVWLGLSNAVAVARLSAPPSPLVPRHASNGPLHSRALVSSFTPRVSPVYGGRGRAGSRSSIGGRGQYLGVWCAGHLGLA